MEGVFEEDVGLSEGGGKGGEEWEEEVVIGDDDNAFLGDVVGSFGVDKVLEGVGECLELCGGIIGGVGGNFYGGVGVGRCG